MAEIRRLEEAPFVGASFLCYNADIYFRKERRETMDYFVLTVASLILFAATFFSTVTGFGFALIAAPVLTMVMGRKRQLYLLLSPVLLCG